VLTATDADAAAERTVDAEREYCGARTDPRAHGRE
jgi:hypothetical protein